MWHPQYSHIFFLFRIYLIFDLGTKQYFFFHDNWHHFTLWIRCVGVQGGGGNIHKMK